MQCAQCTLQLTGAITKYEFWITAYLNVALAAFCERYPALHGAAAAFETTTQLR